MRSIMRLMWNELRTHNWTFWIMLPLPLLWFSGTLRPELEADPYPFVIVMTAMMVMFSSNHRQLERKAGRIAGNPKTAEHGAAGHASLVAKYVMVFVWFILSAAVCHAVAAAYMLYRQEALRLARAEELEAALSVLLMAAAVCYPLQYWLKGKFIYAIAAILAGMSAAGHSIVRAVPDVLVRSPSLLLLAGAALFALSCWPTYTAYRRLYMT